MLRSIKFNQKSKLIISILSIALSLVVIAGALVWRSDKLSSDVVSEQSKTQSTNYDARQLSEADGKDGRDCLVAVEGTVYKIVDSDLWKDGQHTTSNGLAYCGADLTEALKQSPHGKTKLEQLEKVGTYN